MTKSTYILGTALSHDGSSCILKDGKIIVAIEKERITKKKHDGFNDNLTIQYCLDAAGIKFQDIALVVQENTANPILKPQEIIKRSGRIVPKEIPTITISHHIAHAYSVVGAAPFEEMAVVVMDGQGSSLDTCIDTEITSVLPNEIQLISDGDKYSYWEKESYYYFNGSKLMPVFKDFSKFMVHDRFKYPVAPYDMQHSIAEFYGGISHYIFDEEFCEGKLMGLAPYGRNDIFPYKPFTYKDNRVFLDYDWMTKFDPYHSGKYQCFYEYFQHYADLALFAQKNIEDAIFYLFNSYFKLRPHENVGYAGGLALNAVANAKILDNTKFKNLFIQPAPADNGLALGCAYYGWCEILNKDRVIHDGSPYLGKKYNLTETSNLLQQRYGDKLNIKKSDDVAQDTAKLLDKGFVIAWYQEGSEFGPRALGHRSILANPTRLDIRNYVNRKVKSREDFRPFAPSVLEEDLSIYFDCKTASPYMLMVVPIRKEWIDKLPGIVHKDGSARVQVVSKKLNPIYYRLISLFKKITGLSVILNTSLNDRGMPIVETPENAIELYNKKLSLDYLIIGNLIITRKKTLSNQKGEIYEKKIHM